MDIPEILKNKYFIYTISIIIVVVIAVYFTSKQDSDIEDDDQSTNRINEIDQNMKHYMGDYWPYLLCVIFLLVIIVLFMVNRMMSSTETNLVNIDETKRKYLVGVLIAFIIFFSVCVVVVASNSYINDVSSTSNNLANKTKLENDRKQHVQIAALLTVAFIFLVIGTQWIYSKYKRK